ncbi:MAG: hypothetical protein ACFFC6_15695, partial [Promethearchaeota archaeon]
MEYITKEDIRKLLQEKKGDRVETHVANQLSLFSLSIMILGSFYWYLTYINYSSNIFYHFPISVLIGSCFTGFSIFFTTSDFTPAARDASLKKGAVPIILLNGETRVFESYYATGDTDKPVEP